MRRSFHRLAQSVDTLRASKIMAQRVLDNPKIEPVWNSELVEALGDKCLEAIRVRHVQTGATTDIPVSGLFYAIGHVPNTAFLNGQLKTDEAGYLITRPGTTETEIPGVFAAGDVQDSRWRQAVTAAGSGCMAALQAEHSLAGLE